jgi:hypothetical protein
MIIAHWMLAGNVYSWIKDSPWLPSHTTEPKIDVADDVVDESPAEDEIDDDMI